MKNRGYNHKSAFKDIPVLPFACGEIDVSKSIQDLVVRCGDCASKLYAMKEMT